MSNVIKKTPDEVKEGDILIDHRGHEWVFKSWHSDQSALIYKETQDPDDAQWTHNPMIICMGVMNEDETFNVKRQSPKVGDWVTVGILQVGDRVLVEMIVSQIEDGCAILRNEYALCSPIHSREVIYNGGKYD